jgi:hypothetical protein
MTLKDKTRVRIIRGSSGDSKEYANAYGTIFVQAEVSPGKVLYSVTLDNHKCQAYVWTGELETLNSRTNFITKHPRNLPDAT